MKSALFRRVPADPPHLKGSPRGPILQGGPQSAGRRPNGSRCAFPTRPARSCSQHSRAHRCRPRPEIRRQPRPMDRHPACQGAGAGDLRAGCPGALARVPTGSSIGRRSAGVTQATPRRAGEPIIAVTGEAVHVARRVRDYLEAEARRDFTVAVRNATAQLGIPAKRITVRDTKSRWGSCSANGALNFSWRLSWPRPSCWTIWRPTRSRTCAKLNHSQRFWKITYQLCPRTDDAEAWLKTYGSAFTASGESNLLFRVGRGGCCVSSGAAAGGEGIDETPGAREFPFLCSCSGGNETIASHVIVVLCR